MLTDIRDGIAQLTVEARLTRLFSAGPSKPLEFTPEASTIVVPFSIPANGDLTILPTQSFAGGILSASVVLNRNAGRINFLTDGAGTLIDVNDVVNSTFNAPQFGAYAPQVDLPNNRVTIVLNSFDPQGFKFFQSVQVSVSNNTPTVLQVVDFRIRLLQLVPLSTFQELVEFIGQA